MLYAPFTSEVDTELFDSHLLSVLGYVVPLPSGLHAFGEDHPKFERRLPYFRLPRTM